MGGVTAAAFAAEAYGVNQPPEYILFEALGGALVGAVGSRIPDLLEPATSPHHRQMFHSVGAAAVVAASTYAAEREYAPWLRTQAAEYERRSAVATNELSAFGWWLLSVLCRIGAGAISGLGGGYVSHLGCDATTPMSIPLLGAG